MSLKYLSQTQTCCFNYYRATTIERNQKIKFILRTASESHKLNLLGFPIDQTVKNLSITQRPGFSPRVENIPWRREWQSTPVFLPGESHGQRSLVGYSLWGRTESDTTEHQTLLLVLVVIQRGDRCFPESFIWPGSHCYLREKQKCSDVVDHSLPRNTSSGMRE